MTLDEIRDALRAAGLERLADVAERLTLPAIRIEPTIVDEDTIPVGASKLGGRPDLPPDFVWPERVGKALGFLAQFNLAEVALYDVEKALPSSGILYFFYDFAAAPWGLYAEDRGKWIVQYSSLQPQSFRRAEWPKSLPSLYHLPGWLPKLSNVTTWTQDLEHLVNPQLTDDEKLRLNAAVESLANSWNENEEGKEDDSQPHEWFYYAASMHQLIGYPLYVHTTMMPFECEYVSAGKPNPLYGELRRKSYEDWDEQTKADLQRSYKDWQLIFQLGNISGMPFPHGGEEDDDPVWKLSELCDLWARGGLMYFWIERDRLAQHDFSNVWMLGASQL